MPRASSIALRNALLDAAGKVVARQGIANLTLEAVAAEAGMSKGGLLHYFPSKDRLVEGLVERSAECWRSCCAKAYDASPEGPGRMARGLLSHCLSDANAWTDQMRASSSAVFAALAQNPELIKPMRDAYADLRRKLENDALAPGVGVAIAAALDGLWLYWVLGLAPVDQKLMDQMRVVLESLLDTSAGNAQRAGAAARPRSRTSRTTRRTKGGRR